MARPRLGERRLTQTSFRLLPLELEAIKVAAERDLKPTSNWIRLAVQEKLERDNNG